MLIYRLENEHGQGPIGHDNFELDMDLLEYWSEHVDMVEPDGECMRLGHELGLKGHDTVCFGCASVLDLINYWGKLFEVYQTRGLTIVVYDIPKALTRKGEIQVAFPRLFHNPARIKQVYDWPILKEA